MKEFSFELKETFARGLREDSNMPVNSLRLSALLGLRPSAGSLNAFRTVVDPMSQTIATWPFPQFFRGQSLSLLAGRTTLAEVNETTWATTAVALTGGSITAGGPWHFIDCGGPTFFLLNGACVVYRTGAQALLGQPTVTTVSATPTIQTGCAFRGRVLFGGFSNTNYWPANWLAFWEDWQTKVPTGLALPVQPNTNFVTWSAIGGGNVLAPLQLDQMLSSFLTGVGYDYDTAWLFDFFQRGDSGFIPMPFQGSVRCLKALEDCVIAYCDNGVGALIPANVDGIPTFGYRQLLPIGVLGRSAVAGDELGHVFLDKSGFLWEVQPGPKITKLGYQEHLLGLLDETVVGSFDAEEREFYLASDDDCYVLTQSGLARTAVKPTALANVEGGLLGVRGTGSAAVAIGTDIFDMKIRALKKVTFVEVMAEGITSPQVRLTYQMTPGGTWAATAWKALNSVGVAFFGIVGLNFRLELQGTATATSRLHYATLRWNKSDNRFIRGI